MVHFFGYSIGALGLVSGGFVLGSIFGAVVKHFIAKQVDSGKKIIRKF